MGTSYDLNFNVNTANGMKSVDALGAALNKAASGITALGATAVPPIAGLYTASGQLQQFSTDAKEADDSANAMGDGIEEASTKTSNLGENLMYLNQGLEVFNKMKEMIAAPIEKAAELEQSIVQFSVLLGSESAAQQRMKELTDFANTTPFELPEVVTASKLLQTFGGNALATGKSLTMVGDMASAAGVGFNEVAMWVGRANTAMMAGREFGEASMRLQELGLMSGTTRAHLEALQQSGVKGQKLWDEFTTGMSKYTGMMEKQSQTTKGLQSTMSDAASQFQRDIGSALVPTVKDMIVTVTSALNALAPIPASLKILGAGLVMIAPMALLFQTRMGPWPYLLMGTATAITSLWTALKQGDTTIALVIGASIPLVIALAAVSMGFTGATVSGGIFAGVMSGAVVTAIKATAMAFYGLLATPIGPWLVGITAVAAGTAAAIAYMRGQDKAAEEHAASTKKSNEDLTATMIANIGKLDKAKQTDAAKWDLAEAQRAYATIRAEIQIAEARGAGAKDMQALYDRLSAQAAVWKAAEKIIADGGVKLTGDALKTEQVELAKGMLELGKLRVEALEDGYEKQRAAEVQRHNEANAAFAKDFADEKQRSQAREIEAGRHARAMKEMYENAVSPLSTLFTGNKGHGLGHFMDGIGENAGQQSNNWRLYTGESAPKEDTVAGRQERISQLNKQHDSAKTKEERDAIKKKLAVEQQALAAMTTETLGTFENAGLGALNTLTNAIDSGFLQKWRDVFGEANSLMEQFFQAFAQQLEQLAVRWAVFQVLSLISGFGGIASALGTAGGFTKLADGGIINEPVQGVGASGKGYIVGEAGAEAIIPLSKLNKYTQPNVDSSTSKRLAGIEAAMNRPPVAPIVNITADHNWTTFKTGRDNFDRKQARRVLS